LSLPDGYGAIEEPGVTAFALADAMGWLTDTVRSGETLYEWAARRHDARQLSGRGVVYSVPAPASGPDGRHRWAVRHYRRGGAVAPLLADRYLAVGVPRPRREAAASGALRMRGVPTPAVVAGACYRSGVFYRADLVTEMVPGTVDLAEAVFTSGGNSEEALRTAGQLVALLAGAGVEHADLNAKNILVAKTATGPEAYVLDLDRCGIAGVDSASGAALSRRRLQRSLQRLERSLRKLEGRAQRVLTDAEWAALRDGAEGGPA
jgi:3-deoxy-D-manno-octulosonic acid kinase